MGFDGDVAVAPIRDTWGDVDGHLTRWSCCDLDRVYLENAWVVSVNLRVCCPFLWRWRSRITG